MAAPKVSDDEFVKLWQRHGSVTKLAKALDVDSRVVQTRRVRLQKRLGITLASADSRSPYQTLMPENKVRAQMDFPEGAFVVFSDAHYWPGHVTTAHRALVKLLPQIKPRLVVANGDLIDSAGNNRHPRICWQQAPTVKQELDEVHVRLDEIKKAVRGYCDQFIWTRGNHDANFDTRLANEVPQYEGVPGLRLQDHFPEWKMCVSLMLNKNVMIKHRWANGIHAVYNNTVKSGVSIFTGHLHSLKVTPWSDYNGTRYGVDTGTLADTDGPQFTYAEDNPVNWRSGFAVGTMVGGQLLPPELCQVTEEGKVFFRGKVFEV